tara:strand:- start:328 stop:573 length:246 start_codon:yes stop_codon:yes gene_type:complete
MEYDNLYFNNYYHNNKQKNREKNLIANGTTRSKALQKTQKKYLENNRDKYKELSRINMKIKYERDNLETLTLRAVRKLFIE